MNNITYAVSVDVNNPIIPYNVYVASVLDSNVRYLEVTLYENGNVITLSNEATATASLVTDNVLVDDSVECTISNNIITVPLEDLQRHGNLDVQVTVTEGTKVLAIPFPIQVRVTPNIAEEAQIDENSMGSYAEVVQEIAEARGTYDSLKQRIDNSPSDERLETALDAYIQEHPFVKFVEPSSLDDCIEPDVLYRVVESDSYKTVLCVPNDTQRTQYMFDSTGLIVYRTATKADNTWGTWGNWSKIGTADNIADGAVTQAKLNFAAVEFVAEPNVDNCTSNGIIYRTNVDGASSIVMCSVGVSFRTQYRFGIKGELNIRTATKTEGTWGTWGEWENIARDSTVFDAVVRNYQDVTPDITFDIHNTAIATYLTESAVYSPNDYDVTKVPTSLSGTPYDTPNTTTIDLPTGSSKVILYDTVAKTEQVISVSGSTYTITNLIPNRVYAYIVRNSSGTMLSYGIVKATGHIRMIDGGGNTFNIRDLGGWTCDGGKTKYGLIYRGAELNGAVSLNSSQVDFFKNVLGIRDEIDLRSPTSTGVGSGALGLGVDYVNIYINYSPYALQDLYRQERVDIIKRIAKNIKEKKVTYIHCSAGADRTAIICTFIEAICGVSQNDIDRDYELSAFAYDTNNDRLSTRTRNNTWFNGHRTMINGDGTESYSYPYINNMEGSSFQDKIVRFLLRSGVTIDELNDIRFGLIDGNPTALTNPYGNATITKNLSHVFIGNEDTSVKLYQPFEARVLPNDGYILTSVSVTMGGTDITSTAYNAERILIPKVTGDIIITASADGGGVTSYNDLTDKPYVTINNNSGAFSPWAITDGIYFETGEFFGTHTLDGEINISLDSSVFRYHNEPISYNFNKFSSAPYNGCLKLQHSFVSNFPSALNRIDTSKPYFLTQHFNTSEIGKRERYAFRKVSGYSRDGDFIEYAQICYINYHSYLDNEIISQTDWVELTGGGSQIVSGVVNANGTITFTDSDGNTFTTTGSSVIGPQGNPGQDYVLTNQDKSDIADIVLGELPTTGGVLYGN